jgi:hypothetical protein
MVIRLVIDVGKSCGWVGKEVWEWLGFVALECVWVYFCYCSGGCLCQRLQGARVVYSWYSRLSQQVVSV